MPIDNVRACLSPYTWQLLLRKAQHVQAHPNLLPRKYPCTYSASEDGSAQRSLICQDAVKEVNQAAAGAH